MNKIVVLNLPGKQSRAYSKEVYFQLCDYGCAYLKKNFTRK